jgi:hypothetical protein
MPSRRASRNGCVIAERIVAVVADADNRFANATAATLSRRGAVVIRLRPGDLVETRVHIDDHGVWIADSQLDSVAVFDRPPHGWGAGFVDEDESFAAQEWAATWLAVLSHPTVTALSRTPPTVWYSPTEWPVWRDLLQAAGVQVTPIAVAASAAVKDGTWMSWVGGQGRPPDDRAARALMTATVSERGLTNVYFAGSTLIPPTTQQQVRVAVEVLANLQTHFGRLTYAITGAVVSFTAWPAIPDGVIPLLAPACVEVLHGHLVGR